MKFLKADVTAVVGSHGFKDILNGQIPPLVLAGHDGAAIEDQPRNIQAEQGHGGTGNGLVAAGNGNQTVKKMSTAHQFNRIGNDFPAHQRGLHPFGSHGNAIGHRDGTELNGGSPGGANPFLDFLGQAAVIKVAGSDLNPAVGYTHQRTFQILVAESDRFEVGTSGCPIGTVQKSATVVT